MIKGHTRKKRKRTTTERVAVYMTTDLLLQLEKKAARMGMKESNYLRYLFIRDVEARE